MDYPAPPSVPRCPPWTEEPDALLAELCETQIALGIAECHIRLWRRLWHASSEGHAASRVPSYVAHEALSEAGRAIDRIAEMLRREIAATSTLRISDHSVQTPSLPANGGHVRVEGASATEQVAIRHQVNPGATP
jgi:hypothetical protein